MGYLMNDPFATVTSDWTMVQLSWRTTNQMTLMHNVLASCVVLQTASGWLARVSSHAVMASCARHALQKQVNARIATARSMALCASHELDVKRCTQIFGTCLA